jgi:hypothetical protein
MKAHDEKTLSAVEQTTANAIEDQGKLSETDLDQVSGGATRRRNSFNEDYGGITGRSQ